MHCWRLLCEDEFALGMREREGGSLVHKLPKTTTVKRVCVPFDEGICEFLLFKQVYDGEVALGQPTSGEFAGS